MGILKGEEGEHDILCKTKVITKNLQNLYKIKRHRNQSISIQKSKINKRK